MFRFKKEFGYGEIMSVITLLFTGYTFYLVQKAEHDQRNQIIIVPSEIDCREFAYKKDNNQIDSRRVCFNQLLINNAGENTLTLNSIEGRTGPTYLQLRKTGNGLADSTVVLLYSTTLSVDSLTSALNRITDIFSYLNSMNRKRFNVKIAPGESAEITLMYFIPGAPRRNTGEGEQNFYTYFCELFFNFSNGYSKSQYFFLDKYAFE
ncbi:MAG: hypothetical protein E6H09_16240 [Bacteroidetes bacterium]|jgi:hypothetical protein|nr:MAG: hypothetical protein E6H09_16240 [Bacteroidota bacterium]